MGQHVPNPIRHPVLKCMMPWADTRHVTAGTMLQYIGETEYPALDKLASLGCFAFPGATVGSGRSLRYVPAVIWRCNKWTPDVPFLVATATLDTAFDETKRKVEAAVAHSRLRVVGG